MNKRTLRLNILDIVIVICIICSIAAVIFSDYIGDIFISPEITDMEIVFDVENLNDYNKFLFDKGESVIIVTENGHRVECTALSVSDSENGKTVALTVKGYKRFRRLFTNEGIRLAKNTECILKVRLIEFPAKVTEISEIADN